MKRTGEIVLGVIGIVMNALGALFGLLMVTIFNMQEFQDDLRGQLVDDPTMDNELIDPTLTLFTGSSWAILIAAIIGFILGLIGVIAIKGNKKPKLAGIMFIIGAVLPTLITFGLGFLPGILNLIAGIMCFARKAPPSEVVEKDPIQL